MLIYMVSLMILSRGAYRDIAGAQHAKHGAKPGEYSDGKKTNELLKISHERWITVKLIKLLIIFGKVKPI